MYGKLCADMGAERSHVDALFCDLLRIRNCRWSDLIKELQNLRKQEPPDLELVTQLYEYLMSFVQGLKSHEIEAVR